jgi:hypothetical protein
VVSCLSLDYASLFSYVGARTDKHVREHEVYSVGIGTEAARRVIETGTRRMTPRRRRTQLVGELKNARPFGVHRLALVAASLAFLLLVGGGVAVRAQMRLPQLALQPAPAPAKAAAAPKQGPRVATAAQPTGRPSPPRREPATAQIARAEPRSAAAAAPVATGTVQLSILPWGEVFVDGKSRGVSPPLRTLEMPAGTHTIEVRNTSFPAYTRRIDVRSGKSVRISHRFR